MNFADEEIAYYSRQNLLSDFSIDKQILLKKAKVLVIGAGGLGTAVLHILARAGVGTIGIVDYDTIDITNIHRQFLYSFDDIGKHKVDVSVAYLNKVNPFVELIKYHLKLNYINIKNIIEDYDIIVDATDNFDAKYLINDACVLYHKILVFAAVQQTEGQVAVFNYHGSCNYRDIFPEDINSNINCNTIGVINTAVNIIGTLQANEVLKIILDIDNKLVDKILIYNVLSNSQNIFNVIKQYSFSFNDLLHHQNNLKEIKEVDLMYFDNQDYLLIDVRSAFEHQQQNIGGINIPLEILEEKLMDIDKSKKLILYCNTNNRSKAATKIAKQLGFDDVLMMSR